MRKPILLRKRFIPFEVVDISSDDLLFRSDNILITRWKAIKERTDLYGGISYTFLKDGMKLAKFFGPKGDFLYWYCDIIDILYDEEKDTYTFEDLLLDVKIMPNGEVRVLDADELAEALETGLVSSEQVGRALRILDRVLKMIYDKKFPPEECKDFEYDEGK